MSGTADIDRKEEIEALNKLYQALCPFLNFFQPQVKLQKKERWGSRVKKTYDLPRTPYLRLLESDQISPEAKTELTRIYRQLNPFALKREIEKIQNTLLKLNREKRKGGPDYAA